MAATQHTPGPWSLVLLQDRSIKHLVPVDKDRVSLLTIIHEADTPYAAVLRDADAKLIALAPAILIALQTLHTICLGMDLENQQARPTEAAYQAAMATAAAALKMAVRP